MTDQELQDLIASNARVMEKVEVARLRTEELQAKNEIQFAKTDAQFAKTDAQLAKTDAQLAKTDAQLEKTGIKLKNVAKMLGNMGLVYGEVAEESIYRYVNNILKLKGKSFDEVVRNMKRREVAEFDIVAINGNEIMPIEVKNKLTKQDVDHFTNKQLPLFKKAFPRYNDYKLLGGIGGMVVKDDVERYSEEKGLYVFVQSSKGNMVLANHKDFKEKVFA
ncbi:hypothetical protein HON22_01795 [Candidatus Peregrinibacteria bacterium]|nr:hypothetical protein [Candidatus Peregrinibacteria bacterium]